MDSNTHANPSHQVIYVNKQRPLIFTQQYNLKYKKKTFEDIYNSPIFNELSFLISSQYQFCECLDKIHECPKMKEILKQSKKPQAKAIFQQLRLNAKNSKEKSPNNHKLMFMQNEVLKPHFQSVLSVVDPQNPAVLAEILKHLKTDYTTFWVYGLYCSKFESFQSIVQNMIKISTQMNLDLDVVQLIEGKQKEFETAYETKLMSIFRASYPSIINIVCKSLKTEMIIEKLLICHFMKGRQRKEIEVIKAAMQM